MLGLKREQSSDNGDDARGTSMAQYHAYAHTKPPGNSERLILPGTSKYTLSALLDAKIDRGMVGDRHYNAHTGAPSYDSARLCPADPLTNRRVAIAGAPRVGTGLFHRAERSAHSERQRPFRVHNT